VEVEHKMVEKDAVVVEERMHYTVAADLGFVGAVHYTGIVVERAVTDRHVLRLIAVLPSIRRRCKVPEHLRANRMMMD